MFPRVFTRKATNEVRITLTDEELRKIRSIADRRGLPIDSIVEEIFLVGLKDLYGLTAATMN